LPTSPSSKGRINSFDTKFYNTFVGVYIDNLGLNIYFD
jgi:hypothetical protein